MLISLSLFAERLIKNLLHEKKSDSPDEDKSIGDGRLLKPVLSDYLKAHPGFSYDTFMGDSAFDSYDTYPFLMDDCKFKRALIPLNKRNSSSLPEPGFDENGRPLCPFDNSLSMKYAGITRGKNRMCVTNGHARKPSSFTERLSVLVKIPVHRLNPAGRSIHTQKEGFAFTQEFPATVRSGQPYTKNAQLLKNQSTP